MPDQQKRHIVKREMRVNPNMIFHTIDSQSGTLSKALLENIMNSVDALSDEVSLTIDRYGFVVSDKGKGIKVIDEIIEFFEDFGFEHHENDHRTYGAYGIGRAQIFSWASTKWRTGEFIMDVDVKKNGLEYGLESKLEQVEGCAITGKFYDPLSLTDLEGTLRELKELAKYCPIKTIVNGSVISIDPKTQKWDYETDDAYIKLKDSGQLKVYNLGIFVRNYNGSLFGSAGIVVSKKQLKVNTARNDILLTKCEVWKGLKKFLQCASNNKVKKKKRLTEFERENLIRQLCNGEKSYADLGTLAIITDTQGKNWPLKKLASTNNGITISPEQGSQMGERIHTKKMCFVLSPKTLNRFNVETIEEFSNLLNEIGSRGNGYNPFRSLKTYDFSEFKGALNDGYNILNDNDCTPQERYVIQAIRKGQSSIVRAVAESTGDEAYRWSDDRAVRVGSSDVAEAWTDGSSYVVINRKLLKLANQGFGGFMKIAMVLTHEYCHNDNDAGSHEHDFEFYQKFHDVISDPLSHDVSQAAYLMLKKYVERLRNNNKNVVLKILQSQDLDVIVSSYVGIDESQQEATTTT